MTCRMQVFAAAMAAGLALGVSGASAAAVEHPRLALSDTQLDTIAGGGDPAATADGTGSAEGKSTRTAAAVISYVGADLAGHGGGGAAGQVSASATAAPGGIAMATSNLSLSVILP